MSDFHCRRGPSPGLEKLGPDPARSPHHYYLSAGPGPGLQVSGPHPPGPACKISLKPGPAPGLRHGPRAEAKPVQGLRTHFVVQYNFYLQILTNVQAIHVTCFQHVKMVSIYSRVCAIVVHRQVGTRFFQMEYR